MKQIKRIAILGTENSHAQAFTNLIRTCPELTLIGAYGTEPAANERFSVNFGVPCVTDPAAFIVNNVCFYFFAKVQGLKLSGNT